MRYEEQKRREFWAGVVIVGLTVVLVCVVLCIKAATFIEVESTQSAAPATVPAPAIIYTDPVEPETLPLESTTYHRVYYPLTMDERETLAEILAGKAADRTEACQRMVATVMFNDIMDCQGDLASAMTEYHLNTPGTPTAQIYEVIDAVFYGGEFMLDPEVKWMNDKDHPSPFHDSLVFVCECDGIAFYKEHRPAVVCLMENFSITMRQFRRRQTRPSKWTWQKCKRASSVRLSLSTIISVVAWRQMAEFVCRYFRKGSMIAVQGSIQSRNWKVREEE